MQTAITSLLLYWYKLIWWKNCCSTGCRWQISNLLKNTERWGRACMGLSERNDAIKSWHWNWSVVAWHGITQTFVMVDFVREVTAKESCKYVEYGLLEYFLLFSYCWCYDWNHVSLSKYILCLFIVWISLWSCTYVFGCRNLEKQASDIYICCDWVEEEKKKGKKSVISLSTMISPLARL